MDKNQVCRENLLTEKQAATFFSLKPQTLTSWRHKGTGPEYLKIGGAVRYRRRDLERYAESGRIKR